jgi:hypothetical protein
MQDNSEIGGGLGIEPSDLLPKNKLDLRRVRTINVFCRHPGVDHIKDMLSDGFTDRRGNFDTAEIAFHGQATLHNPEGTTLKRAASMSPSSQRVSVSVFLTSILQHLFGTSLLLPKRLDEVLAHLSGLL